MTKSRVGLLGALGLVAMVTTSACPSGDDGGGSSVTAAEAFASCNAYCDALFAACTATFYPTVEVCKMTECSGSMFESAACYTAGKRWWDCRKVQPSPSLCVELGCDSEGDAAFAACS